MGDGTDYEVYQFDLPAHSLTRFQGLPSWIYEVATYPPHEVVAFLRSFWAPLKNPTAIGLKNYLLKQAPTCIFLSPVVDGNIEDATPELCFDTEWHMEVRLANLASPQEMNAALKEFRERDVQFLRELGCYFGEMRFGTPTEYLAQYWFRSWNSDGRFDAKWIGRTGYEEWDRVPS